MDRGDSYNIQYRLLTELIVPALKSKPEADSPLEIFKNMISGEFSAFARQAGSIVPQEMFEKHQQTWQLITRQLEVLTATAGLRSHTLVAVGGGFSAGKSAFVSSLMKNQALRLPSGIEPVTAIPTYVIAGDSGIITGHTVHGGGITIQADLYLQLTHDVIQSASINAKDVVPFIVIDTPLQKLQHIGLVDLPGHNPAGATENTNQDAQTTADYSNRSDALVWVIGIDSTGTLPDDDIEPIRHWVDQGKPVYVVLCKADLRPQSQVDEIIGEIKIQLTSSGIPYEGICAYSALDGRTYAQHKRSLSAFLKALDMPPKDPLIAIKKLLDEIFKDYKEAIDIAINDRQHIVNRFRTLTLNLNKSNELFDIIVTPPKKRSRRKVAAEAVNMSTTNSSWVFPTSAEPSPASAIDVSLQERMLTIDPDDVDRALLLRERVQGCLDELKATIAPLKQLQALAEEGDRIKRAMRKAITAI